MEKEKLNTGRRGFLKTILGTAFAGTIFSDSKALAAGNWKNVNSSDGTYSPKDGDLSILGEINMVAFNSVPIGWASCNGQLLSIQMNQGLFSLLGTTYGGNGQNNFALPNLQGRSPLHMGQGYGLNSYTLGQYGGEVNNTLNIQALPQHTHTMGYSTNYGTNESPVGLVPAKNASEVPQHAANYNVSMGYSSIVGGNEAHYNMPPYTVINFIIALTGVFPSQT